ncbi:MAG: homoisocitrate dehydrogenase [Methanobacteriaceae archaeon]|nr:homoisocitrate dehydrogenase [Methanobacteriaceae archaeon]
MHKIAVIPGDGVGPEVTGAAWNVLEALEVDLDYDYAPAGEQCFQERGTTIPTETIELARKADATLFGAVTTVPGQKSAIITLRKELDLYANLRPIKSYPGIDSFYSDLNFLIVRENTEGLYSGMEYYTEEGAQAIRVITRKASRRICEFAFKQAIKFDFNLITAVHKANVLKKTDGIFKDVFYEVAQQHGHIKTEDLYVDAVAMFMVTQPQRFQVIVTTNLFGDILSDEGAGLVGGLGMVPSANIGDENALFEPVHGSAPDIASKGIANPTAMLLSSVLMLQHFGEDFEACRLEGAIRNVLKEGKVVTPDLGGQSSTREMAREVKNKIDS